MIAVFLHLFNLSVMAGWMVLAVLLLRLCLKKAPRWITCVLWGLVALRLLVPFTIESPISLLPTAETVVSGDTADNSTPVVNSGMEAIDKPLNDWLQTPVQAPSAGDSAPNVPAGETGVTSQPPVEDTPTVPDEKPTDTEEKSVSRMEQILQIAAPVWLVGIGLMLLYELVSVLRVRSRVLDAVRLRDNVWQSDRVSSPFIFGLFRPRIYVPYDLEEPMLEQVLSHERAHLHRRDHWIKPFAFTLLAVYWYNPLLWVGYILLCRDIEVACDQRVVRGLDEDTRRQYATALLQCGVERRSIAACPLAFGEVSIKQRIKSVLNYRKPLLWVIIASLLACSVAAVCLLTVPGEEPLEVLNSQEIKPDQVRRFYGTDTDGALIEAGVDWMWQHAENPDAKTPDIDYWEETNIPLVVSRSKADLDALMDACSDETMQVDMRGSFKLEKYDDTYFEDKVIVWLFVPGYDLATYDYTVTLEETNKGLRYAVTLQYNSTSMFDPWPGRCEYLLLFETDRKTIEEADSLTTRHQQAPIQLPTEEGLTMVPVGNADLDGDGEKEEIRLYHSEFDWDSGWYEIAYLVVCKKDGTPILKEDTLVYKHSQCYLVPQDDGSSLLLFVETDGVGDGDEEEFGVLSLKDGQRTVVQCLYDGAIRLNNLELGEVIFYASSLSKWLDKATLLYECENGSLYYGDELGDAPRYTPLCWMDEYRTNSDDTVQDILENVLASLNGTVTPIGTMNFDQDGQADSLFVLEYTSPLDMFKACLLVRGTNGTILTTIPIHTYYSRIDNSTYLYRVTDSTGKEWLQKVTLFTDGTCSVSDLSMDGETNYRSMTMTEWLNTAAKTGAKMICYLEGNELYYTNGDSAAQSVKIDLPAHFLAVMQDKQTFVMDKYFFNGEAITLSRLLEKYNDHIGQYTLVDMDADSVPELVVQFRSSYDNLVIRKDGDHYYGYLFGIRAMQDIRTDGTFSWAGGAGYIGCSRLRFNGVQYETVELWHKDEGYSYGNYYVDGKAVTKEAYLAATANPAPEVAWAEWDETQQGSNVITYIPYDTEQSIEYNNAIGIYNKYLSGLIPAQGNNVYHVLEKNGYTYTVTEQDGSNANAKILSITNASGKVIQTIRFADNEWFTQAPLYLIDANFDGYEDLIVPFQRPAHGGYFQAYIWDAAAKQYRHAPTFERISNVALDADSKMVLVRCTSDKITTHGMYRYDVKKQDFVVVRTLYWKPSDREGTMQVEESTYNTNGESETMREFTVPAVNTIDVDESDARMAPYFAKGSLWDLDNTKWDVPLISRSEYVQSDATYYVTDCVRGSNGKSGIDSYALADVNGDNIPELFIHAMSKEVLGIADGQLTCWYSSGGSVKVSLLENGALFTTSLNSPDYHTYITFDKKGAKNEVYFYKGATGPTKPITYTYEGNDVTKGEWESLTAPYFAQAKKTVELQWSEWK